QIQNNKLIPPLTSPEKKTVFLDLDETLVHSSVTLPNRFDFLVRPIIHGTEMRFYVIKRPGVDQFLQKLAEKYEVVVFTAGMREYASLVLDRLDRHDVIISHRLYRDSCKEVNGKLVKDLSGLGRDLRSVVIVDDNPNSYVLQPENGIPVRPFIYDMPDGELRKLLMFFESEGSHEDIRDAVREYVHRDGRISDDDDLNDDDSSASETGDDDELETGNGKFTNVPVLTTSNSSTPCCMINLHDYYPPAKPVATESWIKTVILCILILMIINVILCLLILWKA
ncbi:uncharacterized protein LOC126785769, partial [Argentina anserina]|uniref:uncharacterized protein LOC126785769 n=1 Tax=Argentina anserina TaxID=57926 RepID=UPI002176271E